MTLVLGGIDDQDSHVVSQPYIDMTIEMMKTFGVHVRKIKMLLNIIFHKEDTKTRLNIKSNLMH